MRSLQPLPEVRRSPDEPTDQHVLMPGSTDVPDGAALAERQRAKRTDVEAALIVPRELAGCPLANSTDYGACAAPTRVLRQHVSLLQEALPYPTREWPWRSCNGRSEGSSDAAAHVDALRAFVNGSANSTTLVVVDGGSSVASSQLELLQHIDGMSAAVDMLLLGWCEEDAAKPADLPSCIHAYAVRKPTGAKLLSQLHDCGDSLYSQLSTMKWLRWQRVPARASGLGLVQQMQLLAPTESQQQAGVGEAHPLGAGLAILYVLLNVLLLVGLGFFIGLVCRAVFLCFSGEQSASKPEPKPDVRVKKSAPRSSSRAVPNLAFAEASTLVTMRCSIPQGLQPGQQGPNHVLQPHPHPQSLTLASFLVLPVSQLTWQSPSGKLVSMTVPEGSQTGQVLEFQVPSAVLEPPAHGSGSQRYIGSSDTDVSDDSPRAPSN